MDPNIRDRFQLDGFGLDIGVRVGEHGGQSQLAQKDGDQSTDWDLHFGLGFLDRIFLGLDWLLELAVEICCDDAAFDDMRTEV